MRFNSIIILIFMLNLCPSRLYADDANGLEIYIVHVEAPEAHSVSQPEDLERWYRSFLPTTTSATTEGDDRLLYSYRSVFKGFAARLSPEEVSAMAENDGFISAHPEQKLSLHTTHSPDFLGLNQNTGFWENSNYGKGLIIGVIDSGIFPEHPSFSDEGMPPPPRKWKGRCEVTDMPCNNKIIGARDYTENGTLIDESGHGTHTASIAAGNFVKGANYFGSANGTAAGIAPLAHLAIYKACTWAFCLERQFIAAMDAAIEDGVDMLSMSLGSRPKYFYGDSIAVGAMSAVEKGILVICSIGNDGPTVFTATNSAPWILTVGASTIDRSIRATAVLGNNETFDGQSAFQPDHDFPTTLQPLVFPGLINTSEFAPFLQMCPPLAMDTVKEYIKGKIVVCEGGLISRYEKGKAVKDAGGIGMILLNNEESAYITKSEMDVLPATEVSFSDGINIIAYVSSTPNPMGTIVFKGTIIGDDRAPVVASFSSRGPNIASLGIHKPDIIGPGVNIIAAWPDSIEDANTHMRSTFNIKSGTSMACPHLSGVVALLKSAHPNWSPAAIKSAIMTSADVVNLGHNPILDETLHHASIYETGAGHVNPSRANDPGLVYDLHAKDYIPYLCGMNYTSRQVGLIMQTRVDCSARPPIPEAQLNYPSFAISYRASQPTSQTYSRMLTNVGEPCSSYVVEIVPPLGVSVVVEPTKLEFSEVYQKLQYKVTFNRTSEIPSGSRFTLHQGFLNWKSCRHSVRSPIALILFPTEDPS